MNKTHRAQRKIDEFQQQWDTLSTKIERLRKAFAVEPDVSQKIKLEHDIAQTDAERAEVERQIEALEAQCPPEMPTSRSSAYTRTTGAIVVGREQDLETLNRHCQAMMQGKGTVVLIVGEPGIGKTTLVEEFSVQQIAQTPDIRFEAMRCHRLTGKGEPYAPFNQIITLPPSHSFGDLAEYESRQERVIEEYALAVRRMAEQQPLVLWIDDLHWADDASLNLLFIISPARFKISACCSSVHIATPTSNVRTKTRPIRSKMWSANYTVITSATKSAPAF